MICDNFNVLNHEPICVSYRQLLPSFSFFFLFPFPFHFCFLLPIYVLCLIEYCYNVDFLGNKTS